MHECACVSRCCAVTSACTLTRASAVCVQEWEINAAKHVTLKAELSQLSLLAARWRRLELACWQQALIGREQFVRSQAADWWARFAVSFVLRTLQCIQAVLLPGSNRRGPDNPPLSCWDLHSISTRALEAQSVFVFVCYCCLQGCVLEAAWCSYFESSQSHSDPIMFHFRSRRWFQLYPLLLPAQLSEGQDARQFCLSLAESLTQVCLH